MATKTALVPYARREPLQPIPLAHAERRIMHYSSFQKILLVGEGDFSFSHSLATAFGDGRNIMATSLDSQETVLKKYSDTVAFTLANLKRLGALLFHQVDATCMAAQSIFRNLVFDCIIYNFPHAGFRGSEDDKKMIKQHKQLVRLFFENAAKLLKLNGEVHVSHKVSPPYTKWKLEKQAAKCGLMLKEAHDFYQGDYPGYVNRRGDGSDSAGSFHLGKCKTFIFRISPAHFNPWRELSHILGRRPLDFFSRIVAGRKVAAASSLLPHGALRLPLNMHGRPSEARPIMGPSIVGFQRASLKRRMDEQDGHGMREWEMAEDLRAAKRGCFRFFHGTPQIAPHAAAQLDLLPFERRMMPPPPRPSQLSLGPRQGGMFAINGIRPSPLHPPRQHPLLPMFG